jgi:hypothetical protein
MLHLFLEMDVVFSGRKVFGLFVSSFLDVGRGKQVRALHDVPKLFVCSSHFVLCQEQGGLRMGANFVGVVIVTRQDLSASCLAFHMT